MDALVEVGKLGIGWLLAAYLFKLLLDEKDKRVQDSKDNLNATLGPLKNIQQSIDLLTEIIRNRNGKS